MLQALTCPGSIIAEQFLQATTNLVNLLLAGKAPEVIAPLLAGAPLVPLKKKDGGIRPIAIGEIIRRLFSKVACRSVIVSMKNYLSPLQLGVRTPNGCEMIIHGLSACIEKCGANPNIAMLKIDFENAFNLVSRDAIFSRVRAICPSISAWVEYCYKKPGKLWFGGYDFFSAAGVQQGDPLGPLLFAIVLHSLVLELKEEFSDMKLNFWFLDDGTLVGNHEDLRGAINLFKQKGPALGLHLNLKKCELWWPSVNLAQWDLYPPEIIRNVQDGCELLGSALGSASHANLLVMKRVLKIQSITEKLLEIMDPQIELALLRSCIGLPKINFALRTVHPFFIADSLSLFDETIRAAIDKIVGGGLTPEAHVQSQLPIFMGGLGIPSASMLAPAAFIGSLAQSIAFLNTLDSSCSLIRKDHEVVLANVNSFLELPEDTPLNMNLLSLFKHPQKQLSCMFDKKCFNITLSQSSTRRKRILMGSSMDNAGDYLNAVPIPALQLSMTPSEFQSSTRYRLCLSVYNKESCCPQCHKVLLDVYGDHALVCQGRGNQMVVRHNQLRDIVLGYMSTACLAPVSEKRGILDSGTEPADIFVPYFNSWPTAFDLSVTASLLQNTMTGAGDDQGKAVLAREAAKYKKHGEECVAQGYQFIPLAVETLGGWGPEAKKVFKQLSRSIASRRDQDEHTQGSQIYQKLSVVLQKYNASMINQLAPTK